MTFSDMWTSILIIVSSWLRVSDEGDAEGRVVGSGRAVRSRKMVICC